MMRMPAATVASAEARARARGASHVSFRVADAGQVLPGKPFDALVGRFVLMHLMAMGIGLAAAIA